MILMVLLSAAVILGAMALASSAKAKDAVIIAAGDIARCGSPGHGKTAKIISKMVGTVLALGDLAYEAGSPKEFRDCYEPTWGKFKDRTRPAPGNHEYRTNAAGGYFSYWGKRAGLKGKGDITVSTWSNGMSLPSTAISRTPPCKSRIRGLPPI